MPVDGGAILFKVVCDFDFDVVPPASLDPWTWITIIEYLSLRVNETVRVQCFLSDVKLILAKHALRSNHLVVCMDIEFISVRSSEPAFSVLWRIALLPTNVARIVALEVAFGIWGRNTGPESGIPFDGCRVDCCRSGCCATRSRSDGDSVIRSRTLIKCANHFFRSFMMI